MCSSTCCVANKIRPWVFYLGSIILAAVLVGFWFTQESRPSVILHQRIALVRKQTGFDGLTCEESSKMPSTRAFITTMVSRPIRFFFTEPICCTVSIMSATVFGSVYLQTEGIKVIYQSFGFDEKRAALPLNSWIIGLLLTIPLRIFDWSLVSRRLRLGYSIRPEDKLTGFYVAAPVLAVSLWWLSWTIPPYVRLHNCTYVHLTIVNTQATGPKYLPPCLHRRPNTNRRLYKRI
jgi:hypothetical protein